MLTSNHMTLWLYTYLSKWHVVYFGGNNSHSLKEYDMHNSFTPPLSLFLSGSGPFADAYSSVYQLISTPNQDFKS